MKAMLQLNQNELSNLEINVNLLKKEGLRVLIYAKRDLNHSETEEFRSVYKKLKASPMNQSKELDALAQRWEEGLENAPGYL